VSDALPEITEDEKTAFRAAVAPRIAAFIESLATDGTCTRDDHVTLLGTVLLGFGAATLFNACGIEMDERHSVVVAEWMEGATHEVIDLAGLCIKADVRAAVETLRSVPS
jgi:hypothetical protein